MYSHSLKEELSSVLCCDTLLTGCHDGHLRESIDNHENAVIFVPSRRNNRYVIHGGGFPKSNRSRKRSISTFLLDGGFSNGIGSVGSNVLPDILLKI